MATVTPSSLFGPFIIFCDRQQNLESCAKNIFIEKQTPLITNIAYNNQKIACDEEKMSQIFKGLMEYSRSLEKPSKKYQLLRLLAAISKVAQVSFAEKALGEYTLYHVYAPPLGAPSEGAKEESTESLEYVGWIPADCIDLDKLKNTELKDGKLTLKESPPPVALLCLHRFSEVFREPLPENIEVNFSLEMLIELLEWAQTHNLEPLIQQITLFIHNLRTKNARDDWINFLRFTNPKKREGQPGESFFKLKSSLSTEGLSEHPLNKPFSIECTLLPLEGQKLTFQDTQNFREKAYHFSRYCTFLNRKEQKTLLLKYLTPSQKNHPEENLGFKTTGKRTNKIFSYITFPFLVKCARPDDLSLGMLPLEILSTEKSEFPEFIDDIIELKLSEKIMQAIESADTETRQALYREMEQDPDWQTTSKEILEQIFYSNNVQREKAYTFFSTEGCPRLEYTLDSDSPLSEGLTFTTYCLYFMSFKEFFYQYIKATDRLSFFKDLKLYNLSPPLFKGPEENICSESNRQEINGCCLTELANAIPIEEPKLAAITSAKKEKAEDPSPIRNFFKSMMEESIGFSSKDHELGVDSDSDTDSVHFLINKIDTSQLSRENKKNLLEKLSNIFLQEFFKEFPLIPLKNTFLTSEIIEQFSHKALNNLKRALRLSLIEEDLDKNFSKISRNSDEFKLDLANIKGFLLKVMSSTKLTTDIAQEHPISDESAIWALDLIKPLAEELGLKYLAEQFEQGYQVEFLRHKGTILKFLEQKVPSSNEKEGISYSTEQIQLILSFLKKFYYIVLPGFTTELEFNDYYKTYWKFLAKTIEKLLTESGQKNFDGDFIKAIRSVLQDKDIASIFKAEGNHKNLRGSLKILITQRASLHDYWSNRILGISLERKIRSLENSENAQLMDEFIRKIYILTSFHKRVINKKEIKLVGDTLPSPSIDLIDQLELLLNYILKEEEPTEKELIKKSFGSCSNNYSTLIDLEEYLGELKKYKCDDTFLLFFKKYISKFIHLSEEELNDEKLECHPIRHMKKFFLENNMGLDKLKETLLYQSVESSNRKITLLKSIMKKYLEKSHLYNFSEEENNIEGKMEASTINFDFNYKPAE